MGGVLLIFLRESFRPGLWISLFLACLVEHLMTFTAISTLGVTTLSMAVKITSCRRFSTVITALLTTLETWSSFLIHDLILTHIIVASF